MKTFYEAIYEWVVENFGQSEALEIKAYVMGLYK